MFKELGEARAPQEEWARWLAGVLPAELAEHLVSVVIKPPQLIAYADAAVWSTRLRYGLAAIEEQILARDNGIRRTVVRVMPRTRASAAVRGDV